MQYIIYIYLAIFHLSIYLLREIYFKKLVLIVAETRKSEMPKVVGRCEIQAEFSTSQSSDKIPSPRNLSFCS